MIISEMTGVAAKLYRSTYASSMGSNPSRSSHDCQERLRTDPATASGSSRIALILPGKGCVGIAADFPEPFLIPVREGDFLDPLRSFPRIALRDDDAYRPSVLLRERLAVPLIGQQYVAVVAGLERQVRRIVVVRLKEDEFGQRERIHDGDDVFETDAFPFVVEAAPTGDAV